MAQTCPRCPGTAPHEDCDSEGETPFCSEEQECVECLDNTACSEATASVCDDGTCAPCQLNEDCAHLEGRGVCDAAAGECVECTGTDFEGCGLNDEEEQRVCDSVSRTCSEQTEGGLGLCQSCVSDAACGTGMLCIQERFLPGGGTDLGYVCAWQREVPGGPSLCSEERPYVQARNNLTSIDGTEGDICALRVSTCLAHNHFSAQNCETTTPDETDDGLCGEPELADGICELFESGTNNVYRCTVPCGSDDDCPSSFTCDTVANPRRCNLQVGN